MELKEILDLVKGVIQFPATILQFVKILQKTPQENHEYLLIKLNNESHVFEETGRPTWN